MPCALNNTRHLEVASYSVISRRPFFRQEAFEALASVLAPHAKAHLCRFVVRSLIAKRPPSTVWFWKQSGSESIEIHLLRTSEGGSFEGAPFALLGHSMGCQLMAEAGWNDCNCLTLENVTWYWCENQQFECNWHIIMCWQVVYGCNWLHVCQCRFLECWMEQISGL